MSIDLLNLINNSSIFGFNGGFTTQSLIISIFFSLFFSVFILIAYTAFKNFQLYDIRNEILKNTKDNEVLTELAIRSKILKKYPKAFDFEKTLIKVSSIAFFIFFGGALLVQLFLQKDNSLRDNSTLNGFKMNTYQDKNKQYSFLYPLDYNLETNEKGGMIYNEFHKRIKQENPVKYNEIPFLSISFQTVSQLPKSLPGGPEMKFDLQTTGGKKVYVGEVIPSRMPNRHYFVMLKKGYLDISIDPIFDSYNDDQELRKISQELTETVDNLIFSIELK
jgi:hypothetical protein